MKHVENGKQLGGIETPKARGVQKSLFHVRSPKESEDMSVSLRCVRQTVGYCFFSHFHLFALVLEKAWKTKLTQQWIFWFMDNLKLHLCRGLHLQVITFI